MTIHIFGGGTVQPVRSHLALCAPAYGRTARYLFDHIASAAKLHLTRMADYQSCMETNEDVEARLHEVLDDPAARVVVFNVALCDYTGQIGDIPSGKHAERLSSRDGDQVMRLTPTVKLLQQVKVSRPDITLVGFKTTSNLDQKEQHVLALRQIAETQADFVFANDLVTRHNMLVREFGFWSGTRESMLTMLLTELRRLHA